MMWQKLRIVLMASPFGLLGALTSCLSWQVHPLPPTLAQLPTQNWLQHLYVRFNLEDEVGRAAYDADPWLKALYDEGSHVMAYQLTTAQNTSSEYFVRAMTPSAILDISWHLY